MMLKVASANTAYFPTSQCLTGIPPAGAINGKQWHNRSNNDPAVFSHDRCQGDTAGERRSETLCLQNPQGFFSSIEQLEALVLSLPIKWELGPGEIKALITRHDKAQTLLADAFATLNSYWHPAAWNKWLWMAALEMQSISKNYTEGNHLLEEVLAILKRLLEMQSIDVTQYAQEEQTSLFTERLALYDQWYQLIQAFKQFEGVLPAMTEKTQFVKLCESSRLNSVLIGAPTATAGLCVLLHATIALSALVGLIAFLIRIGASLISQRAEQKIEDNAFIKKQFNLLIEFLEQGIINVNSVNVAAATGAYKGVQETGQRVGKKLDEIQQAGQQVIDTIKKENEELKMLLRQHIPRNHQDGHVAGSSSASGVGGASVSQKELREKLKMDFSTATREFHSELMALTNERGQQIKLSAKEATQILSLLKTTGLDKIKYYSKAVHAIMPKLSLESAKSGQIKNALDASDKGNEYWGALTKLKSHFLNSSYEQEDVEILITSQFQQALNQANTPENILKAIGT